MNKQELINEIAKNLPSVSKNKVASTVSAIFETISEALANGEKVTLSGFGTFYVAQRQEKRGVHPQTKKPIVIPAAPVPKFRPGKDLRKTVR